MLSNVVNGNPILCLLPVMTPSPKISQLLMAVAVWQTPAAQLCWIPSLQLVTSVENQYTEADKESKETSRLGIATMIDAVPDTPSVVAVIVTDPLDKAVTIPEGLTVAMLTSDDCQLKVLLEIAPPFASLALAVRPTVSPWKTRVSALGVTTTEVTRGGPSLSGPVGSPPQAKKSVPIRTWVAQKKLARFIDTIPYHDTADPFSRSRAIGVPIT